MSNQRAHYKTRNPFCVGQLFLRMESPLVLVIYPIILLLNVDFSLELSNIPNDTPLENHQQIASWLEVRCCAHFSMVRFWQIRTCVKFCACHYSLCRLICVIILFYLEYSVLNRSGFYSSLCPFPHRLLSLEVWSLIEISHLGLSVNNGQRMRNFGGKQPCFSRCTDVTFVFKLIQIISYNM